MIRFLLNCRLYWVGFSTHYQLSMARQATRRMDILPIPNSGYPLSSRRQSLPSYSAGGGGGNWVRGLRNDVSWSSNQKKKRKQKKETRTKCIKSHLADETGYDRRQTSKIVYVGGSLTVHDPLFFVRNCNWIDLKCDVFYWSIRTK